MAARKPRNTWQCRPLWQRRKLLSLWGLKKPEEGEDKGSEEIVPPRAPKRPSRALLRVPHTPEWREQADFVKWCAAVPAIKDVVINIRNEGKRDVVQAAIAKRMGLCRGASDIFIARPSAGRHGLFLEFKQNRAYSPSERAKPSWVSQRTFIARMRAMGYGAAFAYGCEDAIRITRLYLEQQ